VRGLDRFDETNKLFVVLIARVVNVCGILSQAADLTSSHPAEALTRRSADDHVCFLQAVFPNEGQRIGDIAYVSQMTPATKVKAVGTEGKLFFFKTEAYTVAGHFEAQTHTARAAEQIQYERFVHTMGRTSIRPCASTAQRVRQLSSPFYAADPNRTKS
jgi:hypothetical protein